VAIEQGVPGFFIFIALIALALLKGEQVYHRLKSAERTVTMAALLSLVIILILILINDMIETDKIGSFFFINLAIIAKMDLITRQKESF
jgi:multisubunit Na+/H+ antiporter MnhG subunit